MEVVWNVYVVVVNCFLKRSMTLHDALNGFWLGRSTRTATFEAKLVQQLVGLEHEPLFQVFLDVRKAYVSMDRRRCMEILRGYRMGQNMARLIDHNWDNRRFSKGKHFSRDGFQHR